MTDDERTEVESRDPVVWVCVGTLNAHGGNFNPKEISFVALFPHVHSAFFHSLHNIDKYRKTYVQEFAKFRQFGSFKVHFDAVPTISLEVYGLESSTIEYLRSGQILF